MGLACELCGICAVEDGVCQHCHGKGHPKDDPKVKAAEDAKAAEDKALAEKVQDEIHQRRHAKRPKVNEPEPAHGKAKGK